MATSLTGLSASVTRILYLTGFPKELKTKDIQSAFSEWETAAGGFKIKWRDDTSLLIVFQDAAVAKRAYLHTIAFPPPNLTSSNGTAAIIRPYDGPDAQTVIQTVNSRNQHNSNTSRRAASISGFPTANASGGHGRAISLAIGQNGNANNNFRNHAPQHLQMGNVTSISENQLANGREPSPTLPSLPSHPTLNSLISSSLGEAVARDTGVPPSDPAILATSLHPDNMAGGPRIGDPGKRMLGAALGVRHPALGPRVLNGNGNGSPGTSPNQGGVEHAMREVQRAMGGLVVAE
jgi:hypothetical protein